jgi:hypothetical protein
MAAGTTPVAMTSATVAAASPIVSKSSSMVRTAGASGVSRTQIAVTTPSVPSEPTTMPRRS